MRRTEALQGVRMAMFLNILNRWESAELNQEEAAELLGVSERTFRRWTRRYEEEGEAGLLDRRLGKASGRRVPADRAEEVERLYRERYQGFTVKHFHEHLVKDHGFGWGYTWLKLHLQWAGVVAKAPRKGAHRRKRERRPLPGMMLHQDGSRHAWLEGQPALDLIVTLDDATGAIYSAFLVEEEGTASTFRALKEVFSRARPADEPLYGSRGALLSHAQSRRRDRPRPSDPGRAGARAAGGRAYRGLFAPGPRPLGAGVRDAAGPAAEGAQARRHHRQSRPPTPSSATSICPPTTPASPSSRPARARPSRPSPASISTRSCACRRSGRSERQLRLLPNAETADPAKARCGPISSRRGSRSTSTPTAPTPSSTGPAASAATTRTERSRTAR